MSRHRRQLQDPIRGNGSQIFKRSLLVSIFVYNRLSYKLVHAPSVSSFQGALQSAFRRCLLRRRYWQTSMARSSGSMDISRFQSFLFRLVFVEFFACTLRCVVVAYIAGCWWRKSHSFSAWTVRGSDIYIYIYIYIYIKQNAKARPKGNATARNIWQHGSDPPIAWNPQEILMLSEQSGSSVHLAVVSPRTCYRTPWRRMR